MIVNIKCLTQACDKLKIKYRFIDKNNNFVLVEGFSKPYFFLNFTTPFNTEDIERICKDKDFAYALLKDHITIPKTISFLDPNCKEEFRHYVKDLNYQQIKNDILNEFSFPLIVKRNSGQQGNNVFKCLNNKDVENATKIIFDKNSKDYDYILLAQEYLDIKSEYRVVVFNKEIVFAYKKDISNAEFEGNLSPLHWKNSKAILAEDLKLLQSFQDFISPIYKLLDLKFGGIDIAIDKNNKMYLLEINSRPGFGHFVKDNGEEKLIEMYKKMLKSIN